MPVLEGIIQAVILDAGSKSQHEGPVLVDAAGGLHRVHVIGDNPFEASTLTAWLGRRIRVSGEYRGSTLRITSDAIVALDAPSFDGVRTAATEPDDERSV